MATPWNIVGSADLTFVRPDDFLTLRYA